MRRWLPVAMAMAMAMAMMRLEALRRVVEPETLDTLAEDDPSAVRSRRDLQRVNRVMGTRAIVVKALRDLALRRGSTRPLRILELGCGDGRLMLGVAAGLGAAWRPAELTLLDRQRLVGAGTLAAYAELGWAAHNQVVDVFDWAAEALAEEAQPGGIEGIDSTNSTSGTTAGGRFDLILANLFLHHFQGRGLATLCAASAGRCDAFFACEPRRSRLALAGSHLIGVLGANAVTREDAVTSVRAGFDGAEISALWPGATVSTSTSTSTSTAAAWRLREYPAGLFSHCFRAVRTTVLDGGGAG